MPSKPNTQGNGTTQRHARFESKYVETRHIDVWMPPGYYDDEAPYPVIYMHDGQNLFDPVLAAYNVDWGVDEAVSRLIATRGLNGAIVVGIWNTDFRWQEYMPAKPLKGPAMKQVRADFLDVAGGPSIADEYLKFIVEELKPFIDSRYRTLPDRAHTFIMGSSMGSLISLYAVSEYPDVFGGAGCISTSLARRGRPAGGCHGRQPARRGHPQTVLRLRHSNPRRDLRTLPAPHGRAPAQSRIRRRPQLADAQIRRRRTL
jgi:predicted alpha/beta superfamily hydrolase